MKKEEILEKSRNDNKKKDIYEIEVESKASTYASIAMLLLACIYYGYEIFSGKGTNPAFYSIISIYCAIFYGYKSIKSEKYRKLNVFTSFIWGLLTVLLVLNYFKVL